MKSFFSDLLEKQSCDIGKAIIFVFLLINGENEIQAKIDLVSLSYLIEQRQEPRSCILSLVLYFLVES